MRKETDTKQREVEEQEWRKFEEWQTKFRSELQNKRKALEEAARSAPPRATDPEAEPPAAPAGEDARIVELETRLQTQRAELERETAEAREMARNLEERVAALQEKELQQERRASQAESELQAVREEGEALERFGGAATTPPRAEVDPPQDTKSSSEKAASEDADKGSDHGPVFFDQGAEKISEANVQLRTENRELRQKLDVQVLDYKEEQLKWQRTEQSLKTSLEETRQELLAANERIFLQRKELEEEFRLAKEKEDKEMQESVSAVRAKLLDQVRAAHLDLEQTRWVKRKTQGLSEGVSSRGGSFGTDDHVHHDACPSALRQHSELLRTVGVSSDMRRGPKTTRVRWYGR